MCTSFCTPEASIPQVRPSGFACSFVFSNFIIFFAALFERRLKYRVPVYMSRHPELNRYIGDVLLGIKHLLDKGEGKRVVLTINNEVAS